jgi:hypothetical protein
MKPGDYVLRKYDLSPYSYILRAQGGAEKPLKNELYLSIYGEIRGKEFLEATGRLGGWAIEFTRTSSKEQVPENVDNSVQFYETAEGARLAAGPDWFDPLGRDKHKFIFPDIESDLGDWSEVYYHQKLLSSGLYQTSYMISFTYRNAWVWLQGNGLDVDVKHEFIEDLGWKVIDKLDTIPLVCP